MLARLQRRAERALQDLKDEEPVAGEQTRREIRKQMDQRQDALRQATALADQASVSISLRDFGDNCYVIETLGRPVQIPMNIGIVDMPAVHLSAALRNGNALVFVTVQGALDREPLVQALDGLLSEMDARTAFFRQ